MNTFFSRRKFLSFSVLTALLLVELSFGLRAALAGPRIWNFEPLDEGQGIYRSGQLNEGDYAELKALGFKTVYSLNDYSVTGFSSKTERAWAKKAGIEFHWRKMDPWAKPSMRYVVSIKNELISAEKPVLVHCHGWSVADVKKDLARFNFNRWRQGWADILPWFREP